MFNLRQSIVSFRHARFIYIMSDEVLFTYESPIFSFDFSSQTFPVISPNIGKLKTIRVRLADSSWYNWWKPNGWKLNKVSILLFDTAMRFISFFTIKITRVVNPPLEF